MPQLTWRLVLLASLVVGLLFVLCGTSFATPDDTSSTAPGSIVVFGNYGPRSGHQDLFFNAISCKPGWGCVAAGGAGTWNLAQQPGAAFAQYTGGQWSTIIPADLGHGFLSSVSCAGGGRCVAVGFTSLDNARLIKPLIVQLGGGGGWRRKVLNGPAPPRNSGLHGVDCPTLNWCIAVGLSQGTGSAITATYDGSSWSFLPQELPNVSMLSVACTRPDDCYGVGIRMRPSEIGPIIEHFDGSGWLVVPLPASIVSSVWGFSGITCIQNECTVVGQHRSSSPTMAVAELRGDTWTLVPVPSKRHRYDQLAGVWCSSPTDCIAAGGGDGPFARSLIVHLGSGQPQVSSPNLPGDISWGLNGIACMTNKTCFVVGGHSVYRIAG